MLLRHSVWRERNRVRLLHKLIYKKIKEHEQTRVFKILLYNRQRNLTFKRTNVQNQKPDMRDIEVIWIVLYEICQWDPFPTNMEPKIAGFS